jgi:hypothetical protein
MHDPEQSFPHWRELVEAFSRENPPEDKITNLERTSADVAAVVAVQSFLVMSRVDISLISMVTRHPTACVGHPSLA